MPELAVEHVDEETVNVGNDVHVPRSWTAIVTGLEGIPGSITSRVVYDPSLRRAVADSIRVDRAGEGDEVTTTLLRDMRVQAIVQWSTAYVVKVVRGGAEPLGYAAYMRGLAERQDARSEDETLREAATLYRIGFVTNAAPLKLVSNHLGVSVSTATRMMNRARVAGLVDEATSRDVMGELREQQRRAEAAQGQHRPPQRPSGPSLGF